MTPEHSDDTPIHSAELRRASVPEVISETRVVAILRGLAPELAEPVAATIAEAGIPAIEVTLDSPDAATSISRLAAAGISVGAGTVLSTTAAAAAVEAGAQYLITPGFDRSVVEWAVDNSVPIFPGAFTPTEVLTAWDAGATAVKLFPAEMGGPSYLRAVKAPLWHIPIVPTGGVNADTAAAWFAAGALAVAAGGWLIGDASLDGVRSRAAALAAAARPSST